MPRSIVVRRSRIHGNGVFAARDLPKGVELIQYRGKMLTHDEANALYDNTSDTGHTFLFTLNDDYVIDANIGGNAARWLNHSCAPNCQGFLIEHPSGDPTKDRIVIETIKPVREGAELTYDYGITLEEAHTPRMKRIWACRCGARKCTGTLLKPKRPRKA